MASSSLQSLLLQHLSEPPSLGLTTQPRKASSSSSTFTATTQDSRISSIFQSHSVASTHITYPSSVPATERKAAPQRPVTKAHHCLLSGHIFLQKFQSPEYPKRGFFPSVSCNRCKAPDLLEAWQCALTSKCGILLCDACKRSVETERMKRILFEEEEARKKKLKLAQQLEQIAEEARGDGLGAFDFATRLSERKQEVITIPARTEEDGRRRWEEDARARMQAARNLEQAETGKTQPTQLKSPMRRRAGRANLRPEYKINPNHPLPEIPISTPSRSPETIIKTTKPLFPDIRVGKEPEAGGKGGELTDESSSSSESSESEDEEDDEFNFNWEEEKRKIQEKKIYTGKWVESQQEYKYTAALLPGTNNISVISDGKRRHYVIHV